MTSRKLASRRPLHAALTPLEVDLIRRLYDEEVARGGGTVDRLAYRRISAKFAVTRAPTRSSALHRRRLLAKTARARTARKGGMR